jgi:hypothetical protein
MVKGQRQRATPAKPLVLKPPKVEKAKTPRRTVYQDFPIRPLNTNDSNQVKEVFALSNNFAALMKKFSDTDLQIRASEQFSAELKSKKIKGPLMIRASPNVFIPMRDMEKAATNIKSEIVLLEKQNALTRGQIEHRYEEYVDSLIRLKHVLTLLVGDKETTTLSGHRIKNANYDKETKAIFKKEFDEMTEAEMKNLPDDIKKAIAKDKQEKKVKA